MTATYLDSDIQEILRQTEPELKALSGHVVLMTGAHGFLGTYFTALFAAFNRENRKQPIRLIGVDNHITSRRPEDFKTDLPGTRFIEHDVIQPLQVPETVDYCIHAAGIASPYYYRKYPLQTLEVATLGAKNLLLFSRNHPLKGFLYFSSSEIYGDPDPKHVPTPESYRGNVASIGPRACYDESKRLGETLCMIFHEQDGVPTKIVRPFNIYGPGMKETDYRVLPNFASRIKSGKPLRIYGTGRQTRTFCYVTDAITGFIKTLVQGGPGQAYNIGNPKPEVSMLDLAQTITEALGRPIPIDQVEYPDSYPADEPQRRCPDIGKATLQLGYAPQVSLKDGLRRFMDWALTHYRGE
ncbi:MAG: nucleoside-diphosphate sugar epimerase [Candidatus Omnitrophica bacterium CG11_big_fil_rev_8_21_14_0_20_64_10]|nr:MAG: nucleoside-diphosphate sugar epimerase [Candidatus Omnitrophica bacterium CG11_big_fil_rev_8_21_14_0_20_64_10]